ncbi:flagellar protein FlaG [Konateibacter massiliensis]|uniref:flagellar protein FlaG n=1 Tax=Konateibacter massiliensis TaxID=2002841 RepID=UPI000C14FC87|nr:flagellar protein FlaG [Konateibacter massiliensis]
MELDSVNSKGYQGSSTQVNIKPVQPAVSEKSTVTVNEKTAGSSVAAASEAEMINFAAEGSSEIDKPNSDMKKSISEINAKLNKNTEAVFGIHEATNRVTIKIVDKDSKEVLKEIPPEKTLEMIAKVWEVAGLLVDEKL